MSVWRMCTRMAVKGVNDTGRPLWWQRGPWILYAGLEGTRQRDSCSCQTISGVHSGTVTVTCTSDAGADPTGGRVGRIWPNSPTILTSWIPVRCYGIIN
jgi:hypothetical protein